MAKLFVSKEELNRGLLTEVLAPFIRLSSETGEILLLPRFAQLTNGAKIVVFLLARKAVKYAGLPLDTEAATPKEISDKTGVKYDSVKPTVSALYKRRILQKSDDRYFVPDHAVLTVRDMISPA